MEVNAETPVEIEIWSVSGNLLQELQPNINHIFGEELLKGLSFLRIEYEGEIWIEKILKI